jgi:hypothetical protein
MRNRGLLLYLLVCLLLTTGSVPAVASSELPGNVNPPQAPVKLVFIHNATGAYWLADTSPSQLHGGLGRALMGNNYFVSATNAGWGPNGIGDRTDIPDWLGWFLGPDRETILDELYSENGQNLGGFGDWSRLGRDPGGENQIILLKSSSINSNLHGSPDDPPLDMPNDWEKSVANAKAVYIALLGYFRIRPDKLFVVITAPPLMPGDTTPEYAANARAFNDWLVYDWLDAYPYPNVAVFDYYHVLTGSDNHHRWNGSEVEHLQGTESDVTAYPGRDRYQESHPSAEGQVKATSEFVPLLNAYYNRWRTGELVPLIARGPEALALGDLMGDLQAELTWYADVGEGGRVECALVDGALVAGAGGGTELAAPVGSLRLGYKLPAEGRGGCWHRFDPPQDWSAHGGMSFRSRGDRAGRRATLTLFAGATEAPDAYEVHFEVTGDWELVAFGWEDFTPVPLADEGDPPSLDPSRVMRLGFSPEPGEGTLEVDDLAFFDGLVLSASAHAAAQTAEPLTRTVDVALEQAPAQWPAQVPVETSDEAPPDEVRDIVPEPGPLVANLCTLAPLALVVLIITLVWLRRNAGPRKPPRRRGPEQKET